MKDNFPYIHDQPIFIQISAAYFNVHFRMKKMMLMK